jgi:hypothetical protein
MIELGSALDNTRNYVHQELMPQTSIVILLVRRVAAAMEEAMAAAAASGDYDGTHCPNL